MNDEKWTMPEWMREVLAAIGYNEFAITDLNRSMNAELQDMQYTDPTKNATVFALESLRTAGLLLTPIEKKSNDATFNRLVVENERLRKQAQRIIDTMNHYDGHGDPMLVDYREAWAFVRKVAALGGGDE